MRSVTMFTKFEYSIFNFDSPFYQTGLEVSQRPVSGKKDKVAIKEKHSFMSVLSKLFLRPKLV